MGGAAAREAEAVTTIREKVSASAGEDAALVMDTIFEIYTRDSAARAMSKDARVAAAWELFENGFISVETKADDPDFYRVHLATTEHEIVENRRRLLKSFSTWQK